MQICSPEICSGSIGNLCLLSDFFDSEILSLLADVGSLMVLDEVGTLLDVGNTTENGVHVLELDVLGFWEPEPSENGKDDVDTTEHEHGPETDLAENEGEDLVDNPKRL